MSVKEEVYIKQEEEYGNDEEYEKDEGYGKDEGYIVKLRGLPWSATEEHITKFLDGVNVLKVHLTFSKEGRPSGEAFVEVNSIEDLEEAEKRDKDHMGSRYIEVFKVNRAEMDWVMKRAGAGFDANEDGCVRLRGLPYECSKEEIAQFFTGLEIVPNGITLLTDYSGRSSGEAYVQFANRDVSERALKKHREKIGHRYIEIFRSSLSEINEAMGYESRGGPAQQRGPPGGGFNSRPSPYDRGDRFGGGSGGRYPPRGSRNFKGANLSNNSPWGSQNGGPRNARNSYDPHDLWQRRNHCIHMRGLPFRATQQDIAEFFRPIIPVTIHLLSEPSGRPSGEADVTFASHDDAIRAMAKDKSNMQHRYIELFLNSSGGPQGGGGPGRNQRR